MSACALVEVLATDSGGTTSVVHAKAVDLPTATATSAWRHGSRAKVELSLFTTYPATYPRSIQPGLLFLVEISEAE